MQIKVAHQHQGPILDGRAAGIVDQAMRHATDLVSAEGLRRVHDRFHATFKHPTGFYESRVLRTTRSDGYLIEGNTARYAAWLEGVSSRNTRSRFKGYHTFRLVAQQLDRDVAHVSRPAVDKMVSDLNGN